MRITPLIAFVLWAAATAAQPRSTAGALAEAFAHAWNTHDARAFGALYAIDADWVTVAGIRHKGRAAIEAALGKEHASWARVSTLRATDVVVRDVDPDHAVVMFAWEITGADRGGTGILRGNTLIVATKRRGNWSIIAGQVASLPASK
jgi:uncharacterized protein (TIGR02246 family)